MLADTDRTKSVDLDDNDFNTKFARPAADLPPSAYNFSILGAVCKTMCCGGKNSAYGKSWKLPKNMIQFQQFGADWLCVRITLQHASVRAA